VSIGKIEEEEEEERNYYYYYHSPIKFPILVNNFRFITEGANRTNILHPFLQHGVIIQSYYMTL